MKKTNKMGLLLVLVMPLGAFASEIKIKVNGMVCGLCAQGITKKFKAVPEIDSLDVRLSDKQVTIITKEGKDISDAKIETILKDAGFTVEKIQR